MRPWLAAACFGVLSLFSVLAVFLLPFLWLLTVLEAPAGAGQQRLRRFALFVGTCGLGTLLAWWQHPAVVVADLASWLRPLLGSRWLANGLWIVVIMLWTVGVARLPRGMSDRWNAAPPARRLNHTLFLCAALTWMQALVFRYILGGLEISGSFLSLGAATITAGAILALALTTRRRWFPLWLLLAIVLVLFFWPRYAVRNQVLRATQDNGLEEILEILPRTGLLFIGHPLLSEGSVQIPWDLAGQGRFRTMNSLAEFKNSVRNPEVVRSHVQVFALLEPGQSPPWLAPYANQDGSRVSVGSSGSWATLHILRPDSLHNARVVFPVTGDQGQARGMQDQDWTGGHFTLDFPLVDPTLEFLEINLKGWRPNEAPPAVPGLVAKLNGHHLEVRQVRKDQILAALPTGTLRPGTNQLEITVPTFVPRDAVPGRSDTRALGIDLDTIILR